MKVNRLSVILFALLCIAVTSKAQKIEVLILRKSTVKYKKLANGIFQLIPFSVDTNSLQFVATIKAISKNIPFTDLSFFQAKIQNVAQKLGGNSFRLNNYQLDDSLNTTSITLDVYKSTNSLLSAPSITKDTNDVFIFPPIQVLPGQKSKIKFNDKDIELGYREYFFYHLKPKETVVVGSGGLTSDRVYIYRDTVILSKYISFDNGGRIFALLSNIKKFPILTEDYAQYLMHTYFIKSKTCTSCELKP